MNMILLKEMEPSMTIQIAPEDWIMSFEAAGLMFGPFIGLMITTIVIAYHKGHCEIFYERNKSTLKTIKH